MTEIVFFKSKDSDIIGFSCSEHSGYDEEGKDIVCASISALTTNCINSIECFCSDRFDTVVDENIPVMQLVIKGSPTKEASLILKSLELGIKSLSDTYKDYLSVDYKEV